MSQVGHSSICFVAGHVQVHMRFPAVWRFRLMDSHCQWLLQFTTRKASKLSRRLVDMLFFSSSTFQRCKKPLKFPPCSSSHLHIISPMSGSSAKTNWNPVPMALLQTVNHMQPKKQKPFYVSIVWYKRFSQFSNIWSPDSWARPPFEGAR